MLNHYKKFLTNITNIDDMINFIKQENETLNEQYYNLEAKLKDTQIAKNNIQKALNSEVKGMFEGILNSLEKGNVDKIAKDLGALYKYLTDLMHTIQEYQDPNDLNLDSHNNSNVLHNYYFDDDQKRSSYITQNYEKYKQQQQKDKSQSQLFTVKTNNNSLGNSSNNHRAHSINALGNTSTNNSVNNNYNISNSNLKTSNNNNSFLGSKSVIYQNLMNKTPNKNDISNNSSLNFSQQNSTNKPFNPNPLSSHLKNNNDKLTNKFIYNNKK